MAEAKAASSGLRLFEVPLVERPSAPSRLDRGLTDAAGALRATTYRLMVLRTEVDADPQSLPVPVVAAIASTLADVRAALVGQGPEPSTDELTAALETERDLWRRVLAEEPESAEAREVRSLGGATTLVAAIQAANGARALVLALRAGYGASVPDEDSGPSDPFWYARGSALSLVWHRVRRNLTVRSVEFQNALRLAAGLGARPVHRGRVRGVPRALGPAGDADVDPDVGPGDPRGPETGADRHRARGHPGRVCCSSWPGRTPFPTS